MNGPTEMNEWSKTCGLSDCKNPLGDNPTRLIRGGQSRRICDSCRDKILEAAIAARSATKS